MENRNFNSKPTLIVVDGVSKVKADLDGADGICEWNVDTANNDKILTVKSEGITEDEIVAIVKKKGFKAEPLMV